ncbi:hypothetical protein [Streptomyces sp. NBC_01508]|uniref:hypothetical protein n=1 Tax=Streptomyces sp. NBC_01508 TaxID=2903888 RepID=UPI00386F744F
MTSPAHGDYRADCVAYALHDRRLFWLGGYAADSPWSALTWLAVRAEHIAEQVAPEAALPLRAWLTDGSEHARALSRLGRDSAYSFLVRDGLLIYILSAAPVLTPVARQSSGTTAGPHGQQLPQVLVIPRSSDPCGA